MVRTINGKSLAQVVSELSKPFEPTDFSETYSGYAYLKAENARKRLDEVVGVLNYDFIVTEPQITKIDDQYHISLSGSITIRDDAGEIVTVKSSCGGAPVVFSNETKMPVLPKNDLENAALDVFKRCCKGLNIGAAQLRELRKGKGAEKHQTQEPIALYRVTLREAFTSLSNKGYSAMVGVKGENEPRRLLIWKRGQEEIEKYMSMPRFIQIYKAGKEFSFYGYKQTFKKKNGPEELQIVLEKPFTGNEGS